MATRFVFDLDGTLTEVETLPLITETFKIEVGIAELANTTATDQPLQDFLVSLASEC
jgi:phosphoserine phosphatase